MREVKRYDPFGYDGLSALMHEDQYGSWVHEDDFDALAAENEALVRNLRGKHSLVGATYEHLIRQRDEALAKLAELEAIKGQEPVAFYWQDIGYPEPRTHGPHFGQPSESALRNVDGRAIPVLLYTLPPAERDQDQPQ